MKMKKLTALLLATLMVLSLAACGAKGDSKTENSGDTAQTEEAAATHKSLMDRENEILSENTELWEKVFLAADKGMAMIEDGKNYGDFLLDTIESAKDQFSDEEYALLKKSAQEISEIENKLTELEKQHPEILHKVDFIEGFNTCEKKESNYAASELAEKLKKPCLGGSDAHDEAYVGMAYTLFDCDITSNNDLIKAIREGRIAQWGGRVRGYTRKAKMKDSFYSVWGFKAYNRGLGVLFAPYRKYRIKKLKTSGVF